MRIVVFTGNCSYAVRKNIVEVDRALPGLEWLVLVHAPRRSLRRLLRSQVRNVRRNGLRWITYQIGEVGRQLSAGADREPAQPHPGSEYADPALRALPNVRVLRVDDIHSTTSLETVRSFAPDLGLSLAAPILRPALFDIPRQGTLNLHKGRLPSYRGMPPAFWELWNDEQSVGCTVHRVDERLDTGEIVRETSVGRAAFSTLRGLQLGLDEAGVELMRDAVIDVLVRGAKTRPQESGGKTYRKPTLAQVASLDRKLTRLQPVPESTLKRALKYCRSVSGVGLWKMGLGRSLPPRITVLLYHRVSDDARDNLTVGVAQFDRQMALLRRHCRVLPIEQVLTSTPISRSDAPLVAVTFDDGYLDNFVHAAPILVRHGLPASFFVSTGIVTESGRFPHDVRRGNPHIPVVKWDDLRRMRDWGFTIGSHSVSHIDCAAEPEEKVRSELAESRDTLRRELGVEQPIFAYPYGRRQHMTPQRLEWVRNAGYSGCLSAYGGTNVRAVDRYNVLRRPINWEFADEALLFTCLGL